MNVDELMIGNLFFLPNGKVGKISYHEIRLLTVATEKPNYKPITISEEWLLKLGFEINEDNFYGWLGIKLNENMSLVCMYGFQGISLATSAIHEEFEHIQYVHQLQNLYFSLTGKHLPLK